MLNIIIVIAVLVQQAVKCIKDIITKKKNRWVKISTVLVSIIIVFNMNLNLFAILGMEEYYPVVGKLITAMLMSEGPTFLKNLYENYLAESTFK